MKIFKFCALFIMLLFSSLSASALKIYVDNTVYEITGIILDPKENYRETIYINDAKQINSDLYLFSYSGIHIPSTIQISVINPSGVSSVIKNFYPGFVISPSSNDDYDKIKMCQFWKLEIDDNGSISKLDMANDDKDITKWRVLIKPKSKNELYKLSFTYKVNNVTTTLKNGDALNGKKGSVLSTSSPVPMVSEITEKDEGEPISAEGLTPGCTYELTWDALYETLSIKLVEGVEKPDVETPQTGYNYFRADQNDWVIESVFNGEGMDLNDFTYQLLPDFDRIQDPGRANSNLPWYLYDQMISTCDANKDLHVDGYYTSDADINVELKPSEAHSGEFDLKINSLPCSGLYKLVVTPNNSEKKNIEVSLPIYPNVFNTYKDAEGTQMWLNINGIPVSSSNNEGFILNYLIETVKDESGSTKQVGLWMKDNLDKSVVYTPGLYLPGENDGLYVWVEYATITEPDIDDLSGGRVSAKRAPSDDKYGKYDESFDLSSLQDLYEGSSSDSMRLHFVVSKNGVETPINADTSYSDQYVGVNFTTDVPTAVETLKTDEETPVYFNLQGQRVERPGKGIYIRLQGSKATKVLLP